MNYLRLLAVFLTLALFACEPQTATDATAEVEATDSPKPGVKFQKDGKTTIILEAQPWPVGNGIYPAAEGFNAVASDEKAIRLADSIVKYHGGYEAYANTRYFSWDFFGTRQLKWDKLEKRVRIDAPKENTVYLLDYSGETPQGRVRRFGEEVTKPDSLAFFLNKANSIFLNDSYWLVQQYKLKDSGVTLKYGGEARTDPQANRPSYILDMTFEGVGDTPQNKYRLFIDKVTYRINTWQFFRNAKDAEPAMETSWKNYLPYNGLVLSDDRGGRFQLGPVGAGIVVEKGAFSEF
jgi:hypothetical protein